jgi:hypothetical protein
MLVRKVPLCIYNSRRLQKLRIPLYLEIRDTSAGASTAGVEGIWIEGVRMVRMVRPNGQGIELKDVDMSV